MLAGHGNPARLPPEPSSPVAPQALAEDARFREAGRGFSSLGLRRRGRLRGPWRASGHGGGCAFRHGHRQPTRPAPAPLQGPSQSGKCHTSTGACLISRETNFILCAVAAVDLRLRPTNSRLPEPSERSSRRLPTRVAPCDLAPHSANATVKPAAPRPRPRPREGPRGFAATAVTDMLATRGDVHDGRLLPASLTVLCCTPLTNTARRENRRTASVAEFHPTS